MTRVTSSDGGVVTVNFNVVTKDVRRMGYENNKSRYNLNVLICWGQPHYININAIFCLRLRNYASLQPMNYEYGSEMDNLQFI